MKRVNECTPFATTSSTAREHSRTSRLLSFLLFAVMAIFTMGPQTAPFRASAQEQTKEEFKIVPLKVNVLKGAAATDDDLKTVVQNVDDLVKEANIILKRANIRLDFDKDPNVDKDVADQGTNNGRIANFDQFKKLQGPAVDELKKKFGEERGYKLYIASFVIQDNASMLTPHTNLTGGTA